MALVFKLFTPDKIKQVVQAVENLRPNLFQICQPLMGYDESLARFLEPWSNDTKERQATMEWIYEVLLRGHFLADDVPNIVGKVGLLAGYQQNIGTTGVLPADQWQQEVLSWSSWISRQHTRFVRRSSQGFNWADCGCIARPRHGRGTYSLYKAGM